MVALLTDISITPVESDVSSDDSGLIIDHISGKLSGSIKAGQRFRLTSSNNNTLINVISHGDDIVGNGLYIKPDNSLYQCVMCDYTTKNITQLSRHLEKHQATKTTVTATPKASINIVAVWRMPILPTLFNEDIVCFVHLILWFHLTTYYTTYNSTNNIVIVS